MAATLFAHYPATPGAVEASGDKIHGLSGSFTTSGRMVTSAVRFGNAIRTFDHGVDRLNERYATDLARDFVDDIEFSVEQDFSW